MIDHAIRLHYLDGLEHTYQYSACGCVTKIAGWSAMAWKYGAKGSLLLARMHPLAPSKTMIEFLYQTLREYTYVQFDTSPDTDRDLEGILPTLGFEARHDILVHAVSTEPDAYPYTLPGFEDGHVLREVTDEEDRQGFAAVQEDAYATILGAPPGLGECFFPGSPSVRGPDLVSACTWVDGTPIRAGQLFRSRGLVSGINGAVVSWKRGQHLGEPIYYHFAEVAREQWGAGTVIHYTQPTAAKIAERLNWGKLPITYRRWDMVRSPWKELPFPPGS